MAYAHAPQSRAIAEMNITPLVDVMLVMLVIFMISAPMMTRTIPMNLPTPGPIPVPPVAIEPIQLRIDASGEVFMAGQPAPLGALSSMLSAELVRAGNRDLPLVEIKANGDADYQVIAKVLAITQNAGLNKIRFAQ